MITDDTFALLQWNFWQLLGGCLGLLLFFFGGILACLTYSDQRHIKRTERSNRQQQDWLERLDDLA